MSGRREGELQATAKETREGTTTEIVVGDVSKEEDVESMFKLVKEKYGRVDVVFNVSCTRSDLRDKLMGRTPELTCSRVLPWKTRTRRNSDR